MPSTTFDIFDNAWYNQGKNMWMIWRIFSSTAYSSEAVINGKGFLTSMSCYYEDINTYNMTSSSFEMVQMSTRYHHV